MRAVAIIQARMGSTRLPGKVLRDLAGEPMLGRVVNRVGRAGRLDKVVVATTTSASDDVIVELCRQRGWAVERGSEEDVLDRYYRTAETYDAEIVVRITSDCPLVDPGLIDEAVVAFLRGGYDYVSNVLEPRTYPRGLDVEVFSFAALERAWKEDQDPAWREHVTVYICRHSEAFRHLRLAYTEDLSALRWTVDTREDFDFVSKIYRHFGRDDFAWMDALALLRAHPEWLEINQHVRQKEVR